MKLIISLLILAKLALGAKVEIQATHAFFEHARSIKDNLVQRYLIPKSLIELQLIRTCELKEKSNTLIICLQNEKGPEIKSDPYIINALLSFGDLND